MIEIRNNKAGVSCVGKSEEKQRAKLQKAADKEEREMRMMRLQGAIAAGASVSGRRDG
jgi:hypothetical protein